MIKQNLENFNVFLGTEEQESESSSTAAALEMINTIVDREKDAHLQQLDKQALALCREQENRDKDQETSPLKRLQMNDSFFDIIPEGNEDQNSGLGRSIGIS